MSTRATYTIHSRNAGVQATYYIHHDGYPAGAAAYMMDALFYDNQRGGFVDMFLRANPGAEHTTGRESHGDTEHHYHIEETRTGITVTHYKSDRDDSKRIWIPSAAVDLAEFVNSALAGGYADTIAYLKREGRNIADAEKPQRLHKLQGRYYTLESAKKAFNQAQDEYRGYALRFPMATGNLSRHEEQVKKAHAIYAQISADELPAKIT